MRLMKLMIIGSLFGLSACHGEPLLGLNPAVSQGLKHLHVSVLHHPAPGNEANLVGATPEEGRIFETDLGFAVTLTTADISFQEVHLLSDGDDPECEPGFDQEVHTEATLNLLSEDLIAELIDLVDIPDVAYCVWEAFLGPVEASGHALSAHATDEPSVTDRLPTISLQGEWSLVGASGVFDIESYETIVVTDVFKKKKGDVVEDHPFHFHEGEEEGDVIFGVSYDLLLDDIDFENDTPEEMAAAALVNLGVAVHQHTGEVHGFHGHE